MSEIISIIGLFLALSTAIATVAVGWGKMNQAVLQLTKIREDIDEVERNGCAAGRITHTRLQQQIGQHDQLLIGLQPRIQQMDQMQVHIVYIRESIDDIKNRLEELR